MDKNTKKEKKNKKTPKNTKTMQLNNENNNNNNDTQIKSNETLEYEYFNYVKEPLEKIIYMIDSQINYFNIEDVFRSSKLVENFKKNIYRSIEALNEFDKILDERQIKIEKRKEVLFELNQLFIEHNKYKINKIMNEKIKQLEEQQEQNLKIDTLKSNITETNIKQTKSIKKSNNEKKQETKEKVIKQTRKNKKNFDIIKLEEDKPEEINKI